MANFLNPTFADPFKSVPDFSAVGQSAGMLGRGIANIPAAAQQFRMGQQSLERGEQQLELGQQQIERNKLIDSQKKAAIEMAEKEPGVLAALGEQYLEQIKSSMDEPDIKDNPQY